MERACQSRVYHETLAFVILGETKVSQTNFRIVGLGYEQDVFEFQVSVHQVLGVQGLDGRGQLLHDRGSAGEGETNVICERGE